MLLGPCVTRPMCIGSRCVQICSAALTLSHTGHRKFQHGTTWQRTLWGSIRHIVALHEDSQGYKKIANTLKLSCITVAKIIQCFKRAGFTQNRPQVGRPKKLSVRAERHNRMLSLKDRRWSGVSIAAEIEEVEAHPVSAQTIRRTLHQIGVHGCYPRRKPLL